MPIFCCFSSSAVHLFFYWQIIEFLLSVFNLFLMFLFRCISIIAISLNLFYRHIVTYLSLDYKTFLVYVFHCISFVNIANHLFVGIYFYFLCWYFLRIFIGISLHFFCWCSVLIICWYFVAFLLSVFRRISFIGVFLVGITQHTKP